MKRMVLKTLGIAFIVALILPAAAFAASKANAAPGKDKAAIHAQRQANREAMKEQRTADKLAMKDKTPEERQAFRENRRAEKRAAAKAKVREHRIKKLQDIKAKKEANGSADTPAYQKIVNWLNRLLGNTN